MICKTYLSKVIFKKYHPSSHTAYKGLLRLLCLLSPTSLPLSHSIKVTGASPLFLEHIKYTHAPGPLHLLFLVPGIPFPQIATWLPHLIQISAHVSPNQRDHS